MKIPFILLTGILLLTACVAPPAPGPQTTAATPTTVASVPSPDQAMPPREDPTLTATEAAQTLFGVSPARPTPVFLGDPALPLPAGIVSETLASPIAAADGLRVLYIDSGLHVWNVDGGSDDDLGWPAHAIDCALLGSDGRTLYFSDQRGLSAIDLTTTVSPTLLIEHFIDENSSARHRLFCAVSQSADGQELTVQARTGQWRQLGVLAPETGVLRVVESPIGPPGEPWSCPGSSAWGQGAVLLLSGYSQGDCIQTPGLFRAEWGKPLVPSPVLTGTLPALENRLPARAGAWHLTPNDDHSRIAFWFDKDYARPDGVFLSQALGVVDGAGDNLVWLIDGVSGRNGPPAWSADGQSVYIVTSEQFDVLDPRAWQIRRIGLDGREEVAAELDARFVVLAGPERDGKLLLLILNDEFTYGVHVLDLATGELVNGPADVTVVGWLP